MALTLAALPINRLLRTRGARRLSRDHRRCDAIVQALSGPRPRREALRLLAAALGLATMPIPEMVCARKHKTKSPRFNEFGCVNVGQSCRGRDDVCCSGMCEGRRPRKGETDRSRCVGHDESTCQAGQRGVLQRDGRALHDEHRQSRIL